VTRGHRALARGRAAIVAVARGDADMCFHDRRSFDRRVERFVLAVDFGFNMRLALFVITMAQRITVSHEFLFHLILKRGFFGFK
jgi:hypothetical protein